MKTSTKLLWLGLLLSGFTLKAQIVNIPDANFKEALLNQDAFGQPPIDTNNDGEIQVSEAEAKQDLIVGDPWISYNIQDMTGIAAFVNIHYLSCLNNQLSALDLSQNLLLEEIDCRDNQLTSLVLGPNSNLTKLQCQNNFITSLDVSQNTELGELYCFDNSLTSLQVSSKLKILASGNNQLTSLDLSIDDSLISFSIQNNQLTSLDIRNNNNENIDFFSTENNPDLTCIFVDDKNYSQNNPDWHKDPSSHFVETQEECESFGINDYDLQDLKIYPNPVKHKLYLNSKKEVGEIELCNLQGKKLFFKNSIQTKETLDLSTLPAGVYFLKITVQNQQLTRKIIKL